MPMTKDRLDYITFLSDFVFVRKPSGRTDIIVELLAEVKRLRKGEDCGKMDTHYKDTTP